ncbi:MAG: hypothetical protein ABIZ80_23185 [Bryobacteraceae bacterium]
MPATEHLKRHRHNFRFERILDTMLSCRLRDLTESSGVKVDGLIRLKFPAYYITHPNKVLWILHQHRAA